MQLVTKNVVLLFLLNPHIFCWYLSESLESPELPVFCTPGFKIEKRRVPSSPQIDGQNNLVSPPRQNCPSTPDVPAFETPFVSKLLKMVIHPSTWLLLLLDYTIPIKFNNYTFKANVLIYYKCKHTRWQLYDSWQPVVCRALIWDSILEFIWHFCHSIISLCDFTIIIKH